MKNFGAMAMNDEELDNVVGGTRVNALNDVDRKFARENVTPIHGFAVTPEVAKVLQSMGVELTDLAKYDAVQMKNLMSNMARYGLEDVGQSGNFDVAHNLLTQGHGMKEFL